MTRICLAAALLLFLALPPLSADEAPGPSAATLQLIDELGLQADTVPARERPGWRPPERIVIAPYGTPEQLQQVLAAAQRVAGGADVQLYDPNKPEALAQADVLISRCTPELVAAAPRLRWLHSLTVGIDRCAMADDMEVPDFVITNNQRGMSPDIAEHVIALLLAQSRNLGFYLREQQAGRWARGERDAVNLKGKTLLVLGLGGIGTEIARRAHGLGMRVIATRNSSREGPEFVDYVGLDDETLALAAQADAVANALPLTEKTLGLVDAAFFEALKPGAFYVSVGRGPTTDTDALVAALQSGRLAGAGLDVVDPEPLPEGHPLWAMDNVIITPHISARTDEVLERQIAIAIENLRRYTQGERLLSVVDFERGY